MRDQGLTMQSCSLKKDLIISTSSQGALKNLWKTMILVIQWLKAKKYLFRLKLKRIQWERPEWHKWWANQEHHWLAQIDRDLPRLRSESIICLSFMISIENTIDIIKSVFIELKWIASFIISDHRFIRTVHFQRARFRYLPFRHTYSLLCTCLLDEICHGIPNGIESLCELSPNNITHLRFPL